MTGAVIGLSVTLAIALGAVLYLVHALRSGLTSERASFATEIMAGKAQVAAELAQQDAERAQRHAERLRDDANARAAKAEAERDEANARLVATQEALNKAREENAHATVVKIRSARSVDAALSELERLFAVVPAGATTAPPAVPVVSTGEGDGED